MRSQSPESARRVLVGLTVDARTSSTRCRSSRTSTTRRKSRRPNKTLQTTSPFRPPDADVQVRIGLSRRERSAGVRCGDNRRGGVKKTSKLTGRAERERERCAESDQNPCAEDCDRESGVRLVLRYKTGRRGLHFQPLIANTCRKHAPTTMADPTSCGHFLPHLSPA